MMLTTSHTLKPMAPEPLPPPQDKRPVILVVDDTSTNLTIMGELLTPHYRVRVANSGQRALAAARSAPRPALILLDIMMPEMDGYEVLRQLRAEVITRDIPVIFVTAMTADEDEEKGLQMGAVDYVTKPIRAAILLARVRTHLELQQARDRLKDQNQFLETQVRLRTQENELIKDASLNALAMLAEKRDNETGNHLHRTEAYVEILIDQLRHHPRFAEALKSPQDRLIAKAAPLHDIGKVGIPDHILLKPGRLTPEEFEIMKTHSRIGAEAIEQAIDRVRKGKQEAHQLDELPANEWCQGLEFMSAALNIALHHHEKWDGSGYPDGLVGDAIPVSARLMALADVFDALTCKRHYKDPFPMDKVLTILTEGRGKHFDPDVLDAFLTRQKDFLDVAIRLADDPPRHAL